MRLAFYVIAALIMSLAAPQASAQQSIVVQHYRAYLAALERGDSQAAANAAQAAFDASEARDGAGGRTAVLALNLATVRLMTNEPERARAAAERALELAQAGASGVDSILAWLVVARADLMLASEAEGPTAAAALDVLLASPGARALPDQEVYFAATQLGAWGFEHREWRIAQRAWAVAGARPSGSPYGEAFGLGRARTSEGIAIILGEFERGRRSRIDMDTAENAHALLAEATRVLRPLSQMESPTLELTIGQQAFAEARAWMSALQSKMSADGRPLPPLPTEAQGDADGVSEIGPVDLTRPRCMMRIVGRRMPEYATPDQVATVVMFLRTNADGEIVAHQVAARAGGVEFAEAVERVIGGWRVERLDTSEPNCRMESSLLYTFNFVLPS